MKTAKNISLTVDEKAYGYAKIYAALLQSEYQRKRSYASLVALYSFINTLEKTDNVVQKSMTLFRNPMVNENYEISDLYVNNWHVDIRVITDSDKFIIPKIHFECGIVPDYYVVIKMDSELKTAVLAGFLDTSKDFEKTDIDDKYYEVSLDNLVNYAEFLEKIDDEKFYTFPESEHEFMKANYIAFMDNELDTDSKNRILQHLVKCPECRKEFCCFTGFEMVSQDIKKFPELLDDETLDVIGAQKVEDENFNGKEEVIYFDKDEDETVSEQDSSNESENLEHLDDTTEETDNILDDLFNSDEPVTSQEEDNEKPFSPEPEVQNEDDNELEILGDSDNEELLDQDFAEDSEIQLIDDNDNDENNIEQEEIVFDDNNDNEEIQEVITGYDDKGEPTYSYVENVNQEEIDNIDSESELIEENIVEEEPDNNINEEFPDETDEIQNEENQENEENNYTVESENDNNALDDIIDSSFLEEEEPQETAESNLYDNFTGVPAQNYGYSDGYSQEETSDDVEEEEQDDIEYEEDENMEGFEESEYSEDEGDYEEDDYEEDYNPNEEYEEDFKVGNPKATAVKIMACFIILGILGAGAAFFMIKKAVDTTVDSFSEFNDKLAQTQSELDNSTPSHGNIDLNDLTEQDLLNVKPRRTTDVNKAMTNAFSPNGAGVSLRGINWLCSAELFTDKSFKSYLQNLDGLLKLNLRKNILNATDSPSVDSVSAKLAVNGNGELKKVIISQSSGSAQIDDIVLQSIKESFEGEKTQILPTESLKADMYYLKVVIKL